MHGHNEAIRGLALAAALAAAALPAAAADRFPVPEDAGLYRQYGLPMWGSHLAHEWYSWIPHRNPYKMRTLETALRLKYMTGAKAGSSAPTSPTPGRSAS